MNLCQYQQFDKQSDETLIIEREFNFLWEMATPIYVTYISYYSWFLGIIIETKPITADFMLDHIKTMYSMYSFCKYGY